MERVASSRSFGLVFVALFSIVGAANYWAQGRWYVVWAALAALALAISLLMPRLLAPLKRLWLRLGKGLSYIVSPLVLGLVYLLAIVPVGLLTRVVGKDLLSLRHDPAAPSYWIRRDPGGPEPQSLRDQF